MPFCPSCRSEYREGVEFCATCEGPVPLVAELPAHDELSADELPGSLPVGVTTDSELSRPVEIEGRVLDMMRIFPLAEAYRVVAILDEADIPCAMAPLGEVDFPDHQPRVEIRVRAKDHPRAEACLRDAWRSEVAREGTEAAPSSDVETCPACGAHVPLDVEECPDCGLVVGAGG